MKSFSAIVLLLAASVAAIPLGANEAGLATRQFVCKSKKGYIPAGNDVEARGKVEEGTLAVCRRELVAKGEKRDVIDETKIKRQFVCARDDASTAVCKREYVYVEEA